MLLFMPSIISITTSISINLVVLLGVGGGVFFSTMPHKTCYRQIYDEGVPVFIYLINQNNFPFFAYNNSSNNALDLGNNK